MGVSSITDPEVRAFLTKGTRTGKLGFLSPSGRPLAARMASLPVRVPAWRNARILGSVIVDTRQV